MAGDRKENASSEGQLSCAPSPLMSEMLCFPEALIIHAAVSLDS